MVACPVDQRQRLYLSHEMETMSLFRSSLPCHGTRSLNSKIVDKKSRHTKLLQHIQAGTRHPGSSCKRGLGFSCKEKYAFRASIGGCRRSKNSERPAQVFSCYVAEGDVNPGNVSRKVGPDTKLLIPSLPDECSANSSSSITSCSWEWKPKFNVHYEKAGVENVNSPAVLFLPGFGVGTFHYEKQMKDLGRDYRVWSLDFLGQGRSLPLEDPAPSTNTGTMPGDEEFWGFGDESEPWAEELVYSADLWQEQVHQFINQVIGEPVYIVGNSLGGFISLCFAACCPQLVKGVTLLNATPFWGFLPNPIRSPKLAKLFPWAGTFPLPPSVRKLTELVWQKISDPRSIRDVLKQVYADHSTNVDKVFSSIVEVTQHPAAAAAFASIMFAPKGQLSFREAMSRCQMQDVPICLMYGKEDPWVKPIWGLRVKQQVPEALYYEISPAGHCPHDEVPEVVNYLLRGWIKNVESQEGSSSVARPLLLEDTEGDTEPHQRYCCGAPRELEFIRGGSRKSVRVWCLGSNLPSVWKWNSLLLLLLSSIVKKPRLPPTTSGVGIHHH